MERVDSCFAISKIVSRGQHVGFGIVCRLHQNPEDGCLGKCKKTLNFGRERLTDAEVLLRLKRWMLRGTDLSLAHPGTTRGDHQAIDARWECADGPSAGEVDALLASRHADLR